MRLSSLDVTLETLQQFTVPELSLNLDAQRIRAIVQEYCDIISSNQDDLSKKESSVLLAAKKGLISIRSQCSDRDLLISLLGAITQIDWAMQAKHSLPLRQRRVIYPIT